MRLAIALLFFAVIGSPFNAEASDPPRKSAREVYEDIKRLEGVFPIPTPSVTLNIGTFSGTSGAFTGKKTTIRYESTADLFPTRPGQTPPTPPARYVGDTKMITTIQGKRVQLKTIYAPKVNAVDVLFSFQLNNPQASGFVVTINGTNYNYPPVSTSVSINVGKVSAVNWKITSGNKSYSDYVELRREPIIGVGAFTLPALPFALVYEPPPDNSHFNKAVYAYNHAIGSKTQTSLTFKRENTTQSRDLEWESLSNMRKILGAAAGVAGYGGPKLQVAATVLNTMKKFFDGLGDVVINQTTGTIGASEHELVFKELVGHSVDTGPNDGGPGVGDIIYYLKNPMVMWIADNTGVHLALLDEVPLVKAVGVGFLKANRNNPQELAKKGIDPAVVDDLLGLDPFAANATGQPPLNRYELWGSFEPAATGAVDKGTLKKEWSVSDSRVSGTFSIKIKEERPGWLSFLGLGVTESRSSKFSSTFSNLSQVTQTEETLAQVEYFCAVDEAYAFEVYVDRVFGSFAFRSIPVGAVPHVSGTVVGANNRQLAKTDVMLMIGGKRYYTRTNQQGFYKFQSAAIRSGQAKLYVDNKVIKTLTLQANTPVKNLNLQLPLQPAKPAKQIQPIQQLKQPEIAPDQKKGVKFDVK